MSLEEIAHFKEMLRVFSADTVVKCKVCSRTQYLLFKNGLVNGWSKCHGSTMPIVYQEADIDEAVRSIVLKAMNGVN